MPEQEYNNLKKRISELERLFKFHNHYGYDNTKLIDGHIRLKSNRFLQVGKTYQANNNIFEGLANEANRWLLAAGLSDEMGFGYKTENSELIFEHQKATALSFFYGIRPPLYMGPRTGTIAITSGGNTITDPKQTFTVNELAGAYISIVGKSTSTLETHLIASNTATVITISTTWGISENVDYIVFVPMYLGAANYPWQRVYLMGDIRFGRGASAGANVIYIKYGSGTPETAVTANVGSLFLRTDGGVNTSIYIKESGTGNTGWVALGGGSGMALVASGSFTNDVTISSLNGNTANVYKLIIKANHSSAFGISLQFNADTGANYENMRHYVSKQGANLYHDKENITSESSIKPTFITQKNYNLEMIITAKSGYYRGVKSSCYGEDGSTSYVDLVQTGSRWKNTADNLISIKIITGAITAGNYWLYKV